MKEIKVVTFCDWPGCREADGERAENGQNTAATEVLVYTVGKGRKPGSTVVDLCDAHRDQLVDLFRVLKKADQSSGDRE